MKHFAPPDFWEAYQRLPAEIKRAADRSFKLMLSDPRHPSVQLKKAGPYWSARVTIKYRALAVRNDQGYVWFWIGPHGKYDKIL